MRIGGGLRELEIWDRIWGWSWEELLRLWVVDWGIGG